MIKNLNKHEKLYIECSRKTIQDLYGIGYTIFNIIY